MFAPEDCAKRRSRGETTFRAEIGTETILKHLHLQEVLERSRNDLDFMETKRKYFQYIQEAQYHLITICFPLPQLLTYCAIKSFITL